MIPTGVVTFLFTDIEGSTALWAADRDAMSASLAQHDEILRTVIAEHEGYVFTTAGDSFAIAFQGATDAIQASVDAQKALASADWTGAPLRVRMGIHLGEPVERGGDYFGPVVNLTARLESVGHGGQILLTQVVQQAAGAATVDLGTHDLRDVPEPVRIHQLGGEQFPDLRIVAPNRTNLPAAPSRLIGRDRELALVREALLESRLVTLTAAGGTGKTRLVLAVGEDLLPHRPGGVWFVDLSTISDAALVPVVVAQAVGLELGGGDPADQVVRYLSGIDALIVLDNCEHLVDPCADFLEEFLSRPGQTRILATTREYFDIDGERAVRLPALDASGAESPAVDLFAERALAANSDLTLDRDDRDVIARLCSHLDGSPLAIELAASRCNVMSPTELLDAIGERFQLLRGGRRRRSRQALEDTLDWSYELLDEDERELFRMVGVFVGTFDMRAVTAVAGIDRGQAIELMGSLTAKSLVVSEQIEGATRFRLLETPAAYAERLLDEQGEAEATRHRHLDHYLELCAQYEIGFLPTTRSSELTADRSNILAAIEWAETAERWPDAARLLFAAYEALSTQAEVVLRLGRRCSERDDVLSELDLTRAKGATMGAAVQLDDFVTAGAMLVDSETSTNPVWKAWGIAGRAWLTLSIGAPAEALELLAVARTHLDDTADDEASAQALARVAMTEGWANAHLGRYQDALVAYRESRQQAIGLPMPTMDHGMVLHAEALANIELGSHEAALELATELEEYENVYAHADDVRIVAHLAKHEFETALPLLRAHASDAVTGRLSRSANETLLFMALEAEAKGDTDTARRLLEGVEQTRTVPTIATSLSLANRLTMREEFDAARATGRADRYASGQRAIVLLRAELELRGWIGS